MTDGGTDGAGPPPSSGGWPPPHPSPPLPPPREYGVPGTPPSRAPYVVGAVAVVVVVVVVALLVAVLGGDDDSEDKPATKESSATAAPSETAAAAGFVCWDGTAAETLDTCTTPTGAAGLAWVFPVLASAKCGEPAAQGGDGVVTRVLCLYRLADGTRAQLGFFEWASVQQGVAFYDGQGLTRTEATSEVVRWSGTDGDQAKAATMYAAAPYSVTVTYPAAVTPSAEDLAALSPRAVADLNGAPAS